MLLLIVLIIILTSSSVIVFAHPGSLDSNGGHYNRTRGEYHYHDGLNTGSGSSKIDKNTEYNNNAINTYQNNAIRDTDNTSSTDAISRDFSFVFWSGLIVFIAIKYILYKINILKEKKKLKQEFENNRQKYYELYANKNPLSLCNCPAGSFIKNGLPATEGNSAYGLYTVYTAYNATVYHINPKCNNSIKSEGNIATSKSLRPCKKCVKKSMPDCRWFFEYKKIIAIKRKYDIP